jgi:hypothetical protein
MTTPFHKYLVNDVLPKYEVSAQDTQTLQTIRQKVWEEDVKDIHQYKPRYYYGGSYAKNTMIKGSHDLDLVIYFPKNITNPIKELVEYVKKKLDEKHNVKYYGVALQIKVLRFDVDIVVGKAQDDTFEFADLYDNKKGEVKRSSLVTHIDFIESLQPIVRLMKIWRLHHGLNWHKLAMERSIVSVLKDKDTADYGECLKAIFLDIMSNIDTIKFIDPANSNNPIFVSGDERAKIKEVATKSYEYLAKNLFSDIIW